SQSLDPIGPPPAVPRPKNPIRKIFLGGCAQAANGRATAAPASSVTNCRRFTGSPSGARKAAYHVLGYGLLFCATANPAISCPLWVKRGHLSGSARCLLY